MTKPLTCDLLYEKILNQRNKEGQAIHYMGVKITELGCGTAKGELELKKHHLNPIGSIHGGVIFFMADSVGGSAATTRGSLVTTANATIHYLNAAINTKKLIAEAVELKAGKNLLTYDVLIRTDDGCLISKVTLEYYSLHTPVEKLDDILKKRAKK